jgi:prepilin-type N-terminal cleavage/methylation domain-containing protein
MSHLGGGLELSVLIARSFSAGAGSAHDGTDRGSAPFLRLGAGKKAYGRRTLLPLIPGGGLLRRVAPLDDKRYRRAGFTLVEVIVVLVILAILAAIAIPALTGYIDKARDKEWELNARNTIVAVRSVLTEAYANGALCKNNPDYINVGSTNWDDPPSNRKQFSLNIAAHIDGFDVRSYFLSPAARLLGSEYPGPYADGAWDIILFSPDSPSYNCMNAPAWYIRFTVGETPSSRNDAVLITYGIDGAEPPDTVEMDDIRHYIEENWTCDPGAGYRVFYGED